MKFSCQAFYCAYTQEGVIGHFVCFLMPKEKVALRESMQNVSRSGEKGWNDDKGLSSLICTPFTGQLVKGD
uniref:hypothetical protein n=1 Tax=uncultured Allisonella sp. TaxID=339338 RepID=UPI0025878FD0